MKLWVFKKTVLEMNYLDCLTCWDPLFWFKMLFEMLKSKKNLNQNPLGIKMCVYKFYGGPKSSRFQAEYQFINVPSTTFNLKIIIQTKLKTLPWWSATSFQWELCYQTPNLCKLAFFYILSHSCPSHCIMSNWIIWNLLDAKTALRRHAFNT